MQLRRTRYFSKISVMASRQRGIACLLLGCWGLISHISTVNIALGTGAETDRSAFFVTRGQLRSAIAC